jgi:hypothetical protein
LRVGTSFADPAVGGGPASVGLPLKVQGWGPAAALRSLLAGLLPST